jgi:hypothetical protein
MGHLGGSAHEAKGKGASSMNEFFRDKRTEKADWHTVLGEKGGYVPVSFGCDRLEFF